MKDISLDIIEKMRSKYLSDPFAQAMANSVSKNGPLPASIDFEKQKSLPFSFSVDVWDEGVTDQGESLRCWAFASLNVVRQNVKAALGIAEKNFQLSQNYIYFFDQLEKSSGFLNRIIENISSPIETPIMQRLLSRPIMDNGQWSNFIVIAEKYGVVPKCFMPDTQCSPDTKYITRILEQKLKLSAKQLRDASSSGKNESELYELKERQMEGVFSILCRFLGAPPKSFTFEYRKPDGTYIRLDETTPLEFFEKYGGMKSHDYMMVMHHPSQKRPFMKCYTCQKSQSHSPETKLNLDMPDIKTLVIAQLKGGEQVVMGCDVAKQSHKPTGYMHKALLDYENVFGTELEFPDKASRILYKATSGTHIMSFSGVELDKENKPIRWKVQNSYGEGMGIKGHYVMDDSWFEEYVLSVVINKKYASQEMLKAYEAEPEYMDQSELY
ncbi:MAG: C1 family peptidase [Clostridiaceae bacterium]|nr:C1 family peptidase [Clostridiaceae bacterium]